METTISSATREVVISEKGPTILIGERINPSGKKRLAAALKAGEMEIVREGAVAQVDAGADILDINVVTSGVNEVTLLPQVIRAVMETVEAPLCLDINNPEALKEALKTYRGKPIVNSVTGEEVSLNTVLPLVKQHGAAVIGLTVDERGVPGDPSYRVAIAHRIIKRAESLGIPREDVLIDCLALSVGADDSAGRVALESIRRVKSELGVNQTLGASNISYGLPERAVINEKFLAMIIEAGVTCPTVDAAKVRTAILAIDLILGRDRFAQRYIRHYNQIRASAQSPI